MEEGRKTESSSNPWIARRRDKAKMAWRHRSRNEKILLRIIGFLGFALFCFIIAVVAMDLAYKARIKELENELQASKTTTAQAIVSTSDLTESTSAVTNMTSDPTESTSEPASTTVTTTVPPTTTTSTLPTTTTDSTTTSTTTASATTSTSSDTPSSESTDGTTSSPAPGAGLLESLQSLLVDFSGQLNHKKTWEESSEREGIMSRTRATIAILANIQREDSKPIIKKDSHPSRPNDPSVDIDNSLAERDQTRNETKGPPLDYDGMNDTEDEDYYEGMKLPIDDSSAPHEGSGGGAKVT